MIHLISEKNLYDYAKSHSQYKKGIEAWVTIVKDQTWSIPQDIVSTFGTKATDLIGNSRVIIDIKGNHIRVIAKYQFSIKQKKTRLYIKWIGTHAEYDKLKNGTETTVDMFK